MKTVVVVKPYRVELEDQEVPSPSNSEVLIKTRVSGVSPGTELSAFRGRISNLTAKDFKKYPVLHHYPLYPGYGNCGEIVEMGKDVKGFEVGDRVISIGNHSEYVCLSTSCEQGWRGFTRVPDGVSEEEATLAVLGTTTSHAVRRAEIEYGDNVVTIGDGVLGLLSLLHARNVGAEKVIVIGHHRFRLDIADKMGAEVVINSREEDIEERVFEATGGIGADVYELIDRGSNDFLQIILAY